MHIILQWTRTTQQRVRTEKNFLSCLEKLFIYLFSDSFLWFSQCSAVEMPCEIS